MLLKVNLLGALADRKTRSTVHTRMYRYFVTVAGWIDYIRQTESYIVLYPSHMQVVG